MDELIRRALERGHLVDITTTGRRTGRPHKVELVFHNFDGRVFVSGLPGPRDWYANLVANPRLTFHLKRTVKADLPARARLVTDENERRAILAKVAQVWRRRDLDRMVRSSPLIEVLFEDGI
jgi:deazaflavin-dependent oxidoreductase (nitroreductase family)